ncbi:unnamed protein product [Amoebophrya sp. A120]|nr:unnamed protein product [Amoebophrya sp. A120]|eukprot:GSA120T00006423001.1
MHPSRSRITYYVNGRNLDEIPEVVEVVQNFVQQEAQVETGRQLSLILLLGTSTEYATSLGLQLHCIAPVVDAQELRILPEDLQLPAEQTTPGTAAARSTGTSLNSTSSSLTWRLLTRKYQEEPEGSGNQRDDLSRPENRASAEFVMNTGATSSDRESPSGPPGLKTSPSAAAEAVPQHTDDAITTELRPWLLGRSDLPPRRVDLNGPDWEFFVAPTAVGGGPLADIGENIENPMMSPVYVGNITVPFAPQSVLSGLQMKISSTERVFYKKSGIKLIGKEETASVAASISDDPTAAGNTSEALLENFEYLLTIDACDWSCDVFLNGEPLVAHQGGYDRFQVKIPEKWILPSSQSQSTSSFELLITSWDPTDKGCEFVQSPPVPCIKCCAVATQPRGKQALEPGFIMYSPVTGLWRDGIWAELVPKCRLQDWSWHYDAYEKKLTLFGFELTESCHKMAAEDVSRLSLRADLTSLTRTTTGSPLGAASSTSPTILTSTIRLARHPRQDLAVDFSFQQNKIVLDIATKVDSFPEWSVASPNLHNLTLTVSLTSTTGVLEAQRQQQDMDSQSYKVGLRQIEIQKNQLYLNGELLFIHGVLHQGYWPESLLTSPSTEATYQEVRAMKEAGFNLVRVHMIVFNQAFYAACDYYGLLVMQDMPSGDGRVIPAWDLHRRNSQPDMDNNAGFDEIVRSPESYQNFLTELKQMILSLKKFSSVIIWTLFNEGWGQANTAETVQAARFWDPTRLVDAVSGWNDPLLFGEPHPVIQFEEYKESQERTQFNFDIGDFFDVHNYEGSPFQNLSKTFDVYPFPLANRVILVGEYGGIGYSKGEKHDYDPDASWGYGNVRHSAAGFFEAVEAVLDRLKILACREEYNVVGGVYTQWTDVETEINGLVTYDRVPKLSLRREMKLLSDKLLRAYYDCKKPRWSFADKRKREQEKLEMYE